MATSPIHPVSLSETLASLPDEWPSDLRPEIRQRVESLDRTLVVLDDDPTGTQTVHSLPVLTRWDVDVLAAELAAKRPCFYILTNSRSLPGPAAAALNREIGQNLRAASQRAGRSFSVVSRSDSTLRGHFPGEVDALAETLETPVDGRLIIPFFLEGGRYTLADVHWVAEGEELIPAAQTPYAADKAFGYRESNLKNWVEEKTAGRVQASAVASISLNDLRLGGPDAAQQKLMALEPGQVCIVNAASYRDVEAFVLGLLGAEAAGRNFLYRTAASFVQVRAGLSPRPLLTAEDLALPEEGAGLFVVGSYVPKTTAQLHELLAQPQIAALEVDVQALLDTRRAGQLAATVQAAEEALSRQQTAVIYTSRELVSSDDAFRSLDIGAQVSAALVEIVQRIRIRPRYLIAKGGITSSDVATRGLSLQRADVLGQVLPGIPVWRTGPESRWPGLVYVVFPGNVGGDDALVQAWQRLGQ